MKISEHFDREEFACHCCGECTIDARLIELLEQLRANIGGFPIKINSGYRCRKHKLFTMLQAVGLVQVFEMLQEDTPEMLAGLPKPL